MLDKSTSFVKGFEEKNTDDDKSFWNRSSQVIEAFGQKFLKVRTVEKKITNNSIVSINSNLLCWWELRSHDMCEKKLALPSSNHLSSEGQQLFTLLYSTLLSSTLLYLPLTQAMGQWCDRTNYIPHILITWYKTNICYFSCFIIGLHWKRGHQTVDCCLRVSRSFATTMAQAWCENSCEVNLDFFSSRG